MFVFNSKIGTIRLDLSNVDQSSKIEQDIYKTKIGLTQLALRPSMSSDSLLNLDVVERLPSHIQAMLKRKSSRDPNSRFTSKLRVLLDFANTFPPFEQVIGLSWVDDEVFQINKRALAGVLGVKVNTVNVNLRDLGFHQEEPLKDGWSTWRKEGFTRYSALPSIDDFAGCAPPERFAAPRFPRVGKVSAEVQAMFFESSRALWHDFSEGYMVLSLSAEPLLKKVAVQCKCERQSLHNAIDVLRAIICPANESVVTEVVFVRFLAMFGPVNTAMLKIISLLEIAHETGDWLFFDLDKVPAEFYGAFDPNEANCLFIRRKKGMLVSRAWNLPDRDPGQDYVIDECGELYSSWRDYFTLHPMDNQSSSSNEMD
jgi:hypothetical protein